MIDVHMQEVTKAPKIPISVLVVVYTPDLHVLMIKRTAKTAFEADFWQSITGSLDALDERPIDAAVRELFEETGLVASAHALHDWQHSTVYEIFPQWRHRYAAGVTENIEHWFGLCVADTHVPICLAPAEHTAFQWLPYDAAADLCFSWNNAGAIRELPQRLESSNAQKNTAV
jgi:dATP pyrophosphohydrolase